MKESLSDFVNDLIEECKVFYTGTQDEIDEFIDTDETGKSYLSREKGGRRYRHVYETHCTVTGVGIISIIRYGTPLLHPVGIFLIADTSMRLYNSVMETRKQGKLQLATPGLIGTIRQWYRNRGKKFEQMEIDDSGLKELVEEYKDKNKE